jgi:hypothetical protein
MTADEQAAAQHGPAAVDHRAAQVRQRIIQIGEPVPALVHPEEHILHDVLGGWPVTEDERAQPDQLGPAAPEHLVEALRGRSARLHAHHTNEMACGLPGEDFGLCPPLCIPR